MLTSSIEELQRLLNPDTLDAEAGFAERRAFYRTEDGIVAFVREILDASPAPYQEEILRDLVRHKRMAVRAPHGAGKTAISSWVVLWAMCCFDTDLKVITTASAWRQVKFFTWPEIRLWASRAGFDKIGLTVRRGKELLELQMRLGQREAFAVASDNPALIEGAHASVIVYVFDESKAIPVDIWDAAEGAFSSAGEDTDALAFALAISTPGPTSGRFYDICTRKRGTEDWHTRHITLEEAIAAGRISRQWAEARKAQWGENSAVFKNRVKGEFDDSGEDAVIPLEWVEKAHERWYALEGKGLGRSAWGVDPAYTGEDKTTIAHLVGRVIESLESHSKRDTMWTAGRVVTVVGKADPIGIDTIGVGAGVYDRLRELGFRNARAVNVAQKAVEPSNPLKPLTDKTGKQFFVNIRSYIWWMMREALDPNGDVPLALPPDDELTGDLTAPTWWYVSDGKIQVESKDNLRERIGRSTDKADAVGLALFVARTRSLIIV